MPSIASAIPNNQDDAYDFLVVAVKALPSLMRSLTKDISPLITPRKTAILLLQNGLGIEAPLAEQFPSNPILSGVSMIGSRFTSARTVYHEDPDELKIGAYFHHESSLPREEQVNAARCFVEAYSAGLADATAKGTGAYCILVDDIVAARWRKLLWNGTFNTLCTLLRISVGELILSPGRDTLLEPAMLEMAAIAKAAGYGHVVDEAVVKQTLEGTPGTSAFRPSMLVDLENGRPIELEVILGAPLSVGRKLGVSTPVLDQVYALLCVVQWTLTRGP